MILFVVDVRDGLMPLDEEVAHRLRYVQKTPVILVINKADTPEIDTRGGEFYKLGRGKPVYVSTHQNRNKNQLFKLIAERLPDVDTAKPADEVMKIAVVGRPNTGKSTFINTLAHAERMIVSERPGTTRDSVDVRFELDGLPFVAIDTAGVKRKAKINDNLDFYSIHRAERSIRRADVVLLFLDPTQGITRLDKQLADYIAKQYKPCIFVVNKWDLIANDGDDDSPGMGRFADVVQHAFRGMAYMPLAFITAKTGKNVKALLNLSQSMFKQASKRIGTGTLNRVSARRSRRTRRPPGTAGTRGSTTPPRSAPPRRRSSCSSTSLAVRRHLSALPAERLPREAAVPRHPDQALPPGPVADRPERPEPASDSRRGLRRRRLADRRGSGRLGHAVGRTQLDREVNDLLAELKADRRLRR